MIVQVGGLLYISGPGVKKCSFRIPRKTNLITCTKTMTVQIILVTYKNGQGRNHKVETGKIAVLPFPDTLILFKQAYYAPDGDSNAMFTGMSEGGRQGGRTYAPPPPRFSDLATSLVHMSYILEFFSLHKYYNSEKSRIKGYYVIHTRFLNPVESINNYMAIGEFARTGSIRERDSRKTKTS